MLHTVGIPEGRRFQHCQHCAGIDHENVVFKDLRRILPHGALFGQAHIAHLHLQTMNGKRLGGQRGGGGSLLHGGQHAVGPVPVFVKGGHIAVVIAHEYQPQQGIAPIPGRHITAVGEALHPHLTVQIRTARPTDLQRLFGHKSVVEPVHIRPVAVSGGILPHLGKAGQLIGGKFAGIGGVIIQRLLHHRVDLGLELLIGCLIDELVIVPAVAHKVIEGLIPEISGRAPAKLHRDDVFLRAAQGHKLIEVGLQPPHGREAGGHGLRLRDLLVGGRHMQCVGQLLHGHLRI